MKSKVVSDQIFTLKKIREKACEKKQRLYMDFMDLEKAYVRVTREALWQVLRLYDVVYKLLNRIKSTYVNSLAYVRLKGSERECSGFIMV